jgi:teichuronic acid biosynthesis glycosyltransferase TuaC
LILTVHEDRNWFLNEIASGDKKLLYAWRNADRIIRVNRADLKEFENINIDRSKLVYLPNGFSADQFKSIDKITARVKLNLPQDKQVLLNLAALETYKGQEYLIKSMKIVKASRKDVILYIVGKGSLRRALQSLIDKYDLQEMVILAGGNKPVEEIALWMNSCDFFVLSSLSEGNPTVMFEALGSGKPFIGTKVGGIPDIVVDENLGILVDPGDSNSLAKALLKAIDRDWNAKYISNYADQFTWYKIAEKTANLYRDILGE